MRTIINPPQKVPPPEYRETSTAIAARDFLLAQNVVHDVARPLHLFDQMGWAFFATVAEMHAVFLPFAMAAFWAGASYLRSGRWLPLLLLGVCSGVGRPTIRCRVRVGAGIS